MSKTLKITWDEIKKLIEDTYKITEIKLMHHQSYEGDSECYETIDYVEGELTE